MNNDEVKALGLQLIDRMSTWPRSEFQFVTNFLINTVRITETLDERDRSGLIEDIEMFKHRIDDIRAIKNARGL